MRHCVNRVFPILLALAPAIIACQSQSRIPDDRLVVTNSTPTNPEQKDLRDMVLVYTPQQSFYIDKFEQSELAPGDFFAVRNQGPRVGITRDEAARFCQEQGKRLCKRLEWINACVGTHRMRFSYGNEYQARRCQTDAQAPALTGQNQDCRNDGGLHDMVGNVMEWVADQRGEQGLAMGGSYQTGRVADCFTEFYFPLDHRQEQIGFRCCL